MREIKFRAWLQDEYAKDGDTEKFMMYGWNNEFFYDTSPVTYYTGSFPDPDDPDVILMQYIGHRDKTGKEICENDIAEGNLFDRRLPILGRVVYDFAYAQYALKNEGGLTPLHKIAEVEIIGNIYENPELMEKQ